MICRKYATAVLAAIALFALLPPSPLLTAAGATTAVDSDEAIRARIAPLGVLCLLGNPCAEGMAIATPATGDGPQDPQEIYDTYCAACHGTGANNSPIMGDQEAWQPRVEKGLGVLYDSAINGFNNNTMPVRGLCLACSDEALRATVDWMLEPLSSDLQ